MPEFKECAEAYGVDWKAVQERFMGNEALYLRFLDMLSQDENVRKLGEALDAGDRDGAFAAAHTLKGIAGNLGLTPLYEASCAIVEPLRMGAPHVDYPALYGAVTAAFLKAEELRRRLKGGDK